LRDLKKIPFVNPKIFLQLEKRSELNSNINPDELFEFDASSEDDNKSVDSQERNNMKIAEDKKRSGDRNTKYEHVDNDINIDDI
jgi:hypothetical protein